MQLMGKFTATESSGQWAADELQEKVSREWERKGGLENGTGVCQKEEMWGDNIKNWGGRLGLWVSRHIQSSPGWVVNSSFQASINRGRLANR